MGFHVPRRANASASERCEIPESAKRQTMSRRAFAGASAGFAASLLPGASRAFAQDLRAVSIALSSRSIPGGAARFAQQMGLFEMHGLKPRLVVTEDASIATQSLLAGSVDFTTSGMPEVVHANARGQPMVAVRNLYANFSPALILSKAAVEKLSVRADATVAERLKALDGVLIASTSPSVSFTLALRQAAASQGAKPRLTYMAQTAMPAALEAGAIQGYLASAPYYAQPVVRGVGTMWISGPAGEFPREFLPASQNGLNTMRGYANENPDIIRRMAAVFEAFARLARDKPQEVKAAIATLHPELDAATLDFVFENEVKGFQGGRPVTKEDMLREIAFVKQSGANLPADATFVPEDMIVLVK